MAGEGRSQLDELISRGLAAACAVATEHGLPASEPQVLSARGNLLVHLAPAPVVAKVATLTAWARADPASWLAREVAVASYVAQRGGPVVPPAREADPGPHRSDGLAVSLWTYLPPSEDRPAPADVGEALARLHQAVAGYPVQMPVLLPAREQISEGLAALERDHVLPAADLAALRARHAEILATLGDAGGPLVVLHGDAHGRNLLRGPGGWAWIDLEETCLGPVEWDLAVLAGQAGEAALRRYAAVAGTPQPDPAALAPLARARELEIAVWSLGMAHQHPARYRDSAAALLTAILG